VDNKLVATCYEQLVLVLLEQLVASLLLEQLVPDLSKQLEQAVRTHPDIGLTTTLLYNTINKHTPFYLQDMFSPIVRVFIT
jgi:hypothetical protein